MNGAGAPHLFPLAGLRARGVGVGPFMAGRLPLSAAVLRIFGVTRDGAGIALAGCTVHLFRTSDDVEVGETVSDGAGNYEFRSVSAAAAHYVVAYKPGSPDRAGTTVNTLAGA